MGLSLAKTPPTKLPYNPSSHPAVRPNKETNKQTNKLEGESVKDCFVKKIPKLLHSISLNKNGDDRIEPFGTIKPLLKKEKLNLPKPQNQLLHLQQYALLSDPLVRYFLKENKRISTFIINCNSYFTER